MAQTERITFLATKEFKKWLESEAKKSGMSISELIRFRCESGSGRTYNLNYQNNESRNIDLQHSPLFGFLLSLS